MAKTVKEETKKASKPAKKQGAAKKESNKKTTEKKAVKKNILTTEKKDKKATKKVAAKSSKTETKPVERKTKKTEGNVSVETNPETKPLTVESKSEALDLNAILKTANVTEPPKTILPEKEVPVQKNTGGILPVDDDEDEDTSANNNVQKVYTFNKGIEFMEGHLKIGIDGTNVSRRNEIMFDIYGKSEHGAEFKTEFECIDKEEGDFLAEQLSACEKNPLPFMKSTPTDTTTAATTETNTPPPFVEQKSHALDANGNIDMTKLSAAEIMSIQNSNMPNQDFAGIPVTAVNIDEMINNLPPKPEHQNIVAGNTPASTVTSAADISNILATQNVMQIESYGQSIADHINTSFQANVWGGMPAGDVRLFLKNCDSQYLYDLIEDAGKGYYIKIKRDNVEVRIPKNTNEYLKVK